MSSTQHGAPTVCKALGVWHMLNKNPCSHRIYSLVEKQKSKMYSMLNGEKCHGIKSAKKLSFK